ncbi:Nudix hydrolase 14, chloroplastic [Glycine soja]|nr:Nudix hydrolase 14, chloroplastic isoform B [Glycine soja]
MAMNIRSVCGALKRFTPLHSSNWVSKKNKGFSCKMSTESTSLTHTITLPNKHNEPVHVVAAPGVSPSDFWSAVECSLFKQWLHNLQTENGVLADGTLALRQVLIQGVDMFGKRIGFLKFKADIFDKETGKMVPGIVFARGPAVAVLMLLESEGETYAVLTEQARVPVGRIILELPAGMLDDDKGDFVGTAVREVEEEIGMKLNVGDMVDLTAFLDSATGCKVFPSGGGCDEEISIFLYRGRVDKEIISQLQGKETGLREHGELIKWHLSTVSGFGPEKALFLQPKRTIVGSDSYFVKLYASMAMNIRFVCGALKRFTPLHSSNWVSKKNKGFFCKMSTESPSLTHTITLPNKHNEPVHIVAAPGVSNSDFWCAVESSLFKQWLHNLQTENGILADGTMTLRQVRIQGVDMFGKRIGFLKFKADIFDKETGKMIPGIVFARGPAVAVLILLESEGETYAVLTEQARVPVGRNILELPAGMLDDDKGDFVGTAVREVEEETGLKLNVEDMVDLTAFLDSTTGCRVFPSGGGCDEEISIFLYRGCVDKEIITQLQGKETGLREHGELIKVRVVPYKKLWRTTADCMVLVAVALLEMAMKEGLLPTLST